jgi:4-amino-4-deoxy-L-arabinose transferase-like glycosyltransferase
MANRVEATAKSLSASKLRQATLALLGLILVVLVVTFLNLPWRPDIKGIPPDSGFYAYIGKALLHSQVLYRDVWDDKPPLGYYLDAVALAIFGQNPWGLWWSGIVWIAACLVLFYLVLKKPFGKLTAIFSCAFFILALMNPQLFQGGNMMEVYALVPQIGLIASLFRYIQNPRNFWYPILAGVLTACAYLIKQPTIVLGCASFLVMVISRISEWKLRQALVVSARFLLGFAGVVVLAASYWLVTGNLSYFIDGAILQGFSFIGGGESSLREYFFYTLVNVLPNLSIGWLYVVAMLSGGIFIIEMLYRVWLKPVLNADRGWLNRLVLVVLVIFPVVAGKLWPHSWLGKFWLASIFAIGLFILYRFYRLPSRPKIAQVFSPLEWAWLAAMIALPFEVLMASLGGRYFGHYFITMIPAIILAIAYPIWRVRSSLVPLHRLPDSPRASLFYSIPLILAFVWGGFALKYALPSRDYTGNLQAIFQNKDVANNLEQYIRSTTQLNDEVLIWHIHLGIDFVAGRKAPNRVLFPLNLFIPPTAANTRLREFLNGLEAAPPELILVQNVSSISLPFVDQPIDQACDTYCTPEFSQALKVPEIDQAWHAFQQFFYAHYSLDTRIFDWKIYRRLP